MFIDPFSQYTNFMEFFKIHPPLLIPSREALNHSVENVNPIFYIDVA